MDADDTTTTTSGCCCGSDAPGFHLFVSGTNPPVALSSAGGSVIVTDHTRAWPIHLLATGREAGEVVLALSDEEAIGVAGDSVVVQDEPMTWFLESADEDSARFRIRSSTGGHLARLDDDSVGLTADPGSATTFLVRPAEPNAGLGWAAEPGAVDDAANSTHLWLFEQALRLLREPGFVPPPGPGQEPRDPAEAAGERPVPPRDPRRDRRRGQHGYHRHPDVGLHLQRALLRAEEGHRRFLGPAARDDPRAQLRPGLLPQRAGVERLPPGGPGARVVDPLPDRPVPAQARLELPQHPDRLLHEDVHLPERGVRLPARQLRGVRARPPGRACPAVVRGLRIEGDVTTDWWLQAAELGYAKSQEWVGQPDSPLNSGPLFELPRRAAAGLGNERWARDTREMLHHAQSLTVALLLAWADSPAAMVRAVFVPPDGSQVLLGDAKHTKCLVAGDSYNGRVFHQNSLGRQNARWVLTKVDAPPGRPHPFAEGVVYSLRDAKHGKYVVAGDNADNHVYHQDLGDRPNGWWSFSPVYRAGRLVTRTIEGQLYTGYHLVDQKHGLCLVAGDNEDNNVYHQPHLNRDNAIWFFGPDLPW